jgi:hypothetical protein
VALIAIETGGLQIVLCFRPPAALGVLLASMHGMHSVAACRCILTPILPRVFTSMLLSSPPASCVMGACLLTVCAAGLGRASPLLEPHVCISCEPAWQLGLAVAAFVCLCLYPALSTAFVPVAAGCVGTNFESAAFWLWTQCSCIKMVVRSARQSFCCVQVRCNVSLFEESPRRWLAHLLAGRLPCGWGCGQCFILLPCTVIPLCYRCIQASHAVVP